MSRMSLQGLALGLLLAIAATTASADVGVSISVGEPGFYGQIDIGDFPRPRLLYGEPVIVDHVHVVPGPVYLHVPPGHAKHWDKHCHHYHACNRRVYFVEDAWYEGVYVPEYRERHRHHKGKKHHHKKHHDD